MNFFKPKQHLEAPNEGASLEPDSGQTPLKGGDAPTNKRAKQSKPDSKKGYEAGWETNFKVKLHANDFIILHGNNQDYYSTATGYGSLIEKVRDLAIRAGFHDTCEMDFLQKKSTRGSSASNPTDLFKQLEGQIKKYMPKVNEEVSPEGSINIDEAEAALQKDFIKSIEASGINLQLSDFFIDFFKAVSNRTFRYKQPHLFVLDFADNIFLKNQREPNVEVIKTLSLLGKALSMIKAHNPEKTHAFLILSKTDISSSLSHGGIDEGLIAKVVLPKPDRIERERFLRYAFKQSGIKTTEEQLMQLVDSSEGSLLRELNGLVRLTKAKKNQDLASNWMLLKHGVATNPWELNTQDKVTGIEGFLRSQVIGQERALAKVSDKIKSAMLGVSSIMHSSDSAPKAVMFFTGPTGVGKTEMAKAITRFIFGDESAYLRFDMSEFRGEQEASRLVGSPPGYVGHENGGTLTKEVMAKPFSVVLLDEIEKAHPSVLDKFLQIIADGRLTDGLGNTVSFKDTVLIFTSNLGASSSHPKDEEGRFRDTKEDFEQAVKKFFTDINRVEILGRLGDGIVVFDFLTDPITVSSIIDLKLNLANKRLNTKLGLKGIEFRDRQHFYDDLSQHHFDYQFGARGIMSALERVYVSPLSKFYIEHKSEFSVDKTLVVEYYLEDKELKFELVSNGGTNE